ncbi:MAG TPA: aromatic-ring-hydroxylating dioxygenase subunit beta [Telluria sp.]|nr:aromatic-ring-hydroxylating dioxygenase subunit beta [Telluria sp.]
MAPTPALATPQPGIDSEALAAFVHRELDLLDQRRFEDWAALFTEDGYYWAPVAPDQASPLDHVSLFYDDVRTMKIRIARLRHPRIYVQNPASRTVHLVSNFRDIEEDGSGAVRLRCNFILFEFRLTKGQQIYGGTYDYLLRREGGDWRIAQKKASLANSEDMFPSLAVWF